MCLVSSNHPIADTQLAKSWQTNSAVQHGLLVAQRQLIASSTFPVFPLSTQTYFFSYKTDSSPSSQCAGWRNQHIPACSFKNWPALPHIQEGKSQSPLTADVIFHSLLTAPVKRVLLIHNPAPETEWWRFPYIKSTALNMATNIYCQSHCASHLWSFWRLFCRLKRRFHFSWMWMSARHVMRKAKRGSTASSSSSSSAAAMTRLLPAPSQVITKSKNWSHNRHVWNGIPYRHWSAKVNPFHGQSLSKPECRLPPLPCRKSDWVTWWTWCQYNDSANWIKSCCLSQ